MIEKKKGEKWIAVTGTRTFDEHELLYCKMDFFVSNLSVPPVILVGGQKQRKFHSLNNYRWVGVDYFAGMWAYSKKYTLRIYHPESFEKSALQASHREMVSEASSLIAFYDGKSKDVYFVIGLAEKKKIPIKIVKC